MPVVPGLGNRVETHFGLFQSHGCRVRVEAIHRLSRRAGVARRAKSSDDRPQVFRGEGLPVAKVDERAIKGAAPQSNVDGDPPCTR
jgi:hypothetical protein